MNTIIKKLLTKRTHLLGEKILPFIQEGESVLDFGCSDMAILKYIASKKKISFTGIDIFDYNVQDANFIKYDGGKLPFKDEQFDVVLSLFVLHHTDNSPFYLKELIRVSKRKIILCEDTYQNKIEEILAKLMHCIYNYNLIKNINKRPINFKSIKEWNELFEKNKVNIKTFKRISSFPFSFIPTRMVIIELWK
jgi:ubiquinone/menaquinone biosynthesis C-methylase UbiE